MANGNGTSFFEKNGSTLVLIVAMLVGWISNYAVLQAHVDEYQRRIDVVEKQLVPRDEAIERETQLNKRLDTVQDTLNRLQDSVEALNIQIKTMQLNGSMPDYARKKQ